MKKIVVVFAMAMVWLAGDAQDQNAPSQNANTSGKAEESSGGGGAFLLGFRYMPTFTNFDVQNSEGGALETTFILGHGFGGLIGTNFNNHIGIQAEVIYSDLAQQYRDGSLDYKIHLNYVNIPLMLVLHTNYSAPVNLNIAFGPQFGINTGSSISSTETSGGDSVHAVLAVKPGDLGFAYGAGLDFGVGSAVKLSIGYRGVIGLVDISDPNKSITTDQYYILERSHVNTYAGYIGLTFGF